MRAAIAGLEVQEARIVVRLALADVRHMAEHQCQLDTLRVTRRRAEDQLVALERVMPPALHVGRSTRTACVRLRRRRTSKEELARK